MVMVVLADLQQLRQRVLQQHLLPMALTRTGYTFAHWNTQAGGGGTSYAAGASFPFNTATR